MGASLRTLRRSFKLWTLYARLDLIWMLRDTKMFIMWSTTDALINFASVSAALLVAARFTGIGSWTRAEVVFLLGYSTLVAGLQEILFGFNIGFISRRVGRGQLDHILIQPQPMWMALLTEGFTPFSASGSLIVGAGLLTYGFVGLHRIFPAYWAVLLCANLAASLTVVMAYQFLWGSLAFWSPRAAEEINSSTLRLVYQLKPYPLDGAGPLLIGALTTVAPVGLVAWLPCRELLHGHSLFVTPAAALVFAAVAAIAFKTGLNHYERTGSQRYSSFGHRS